MRRVVGCGENEGGGSEEEGMRSVERMRRVVGCGESEEGGEVWRE